MRAEIVTCGDVANGRVIVSRIKPIGKDSICFEFHRGEKGNFQVSFFILTPDEAREVAKALVTIADEECSGGSL